MSSVLTSIVRLATTPTSSVSSFPSATVTFDYSQSKSYTLTDTSSFSISAVTDKDIMPQSLTKIYALLIRVKGANVTVKLNSQSIPVDDVLYWANATNYISTLTVSGTADIEVFAAGE